MYQTMYNVTLLRGVLALFIIWHHLGTVPLYFMGKNVSFLLNFPGRITVWLFFILSGYSCYYGFSKNKYSFTKKDCLRFYYNRALRILPLFYFSTLVLYLLNYFYTPNNIPGSNHVIKSLFIIFNINFTNGINEFMPTWFLGVLIHFYIFAPGIIIIYKNTLYKLNFSLLFLSILILGILSHFLGYIIAGSFDIRNFPGNLFFFVVGFFIYDFQNDRYKVTTFIQLLNNIALWKLWIIVIVLYIFATIIYQTGFFFLLPMELYIGLLGVFLMSILLRKKNEVSSRITNNQFIKILYSLGFYSYGLYLFHSIVINLVRNINFLNFILPKIDSIVTLMIGFCVTTAGSYILSRFFYVLLEKPFLKLQKR